MMMLALTTGLVVEGGGQYYNFGTCLLCLLRAKLASGRPHWDSSFTVTFVFTFILNKNLEDGTKLTFARSINLIDREPNYRRETI